MEVKSFDSLPFDIVIEIFQYLSIEELVSSVQYVNKHWQNVIQDPIFWRDVWYKPGAGINTDKVVTFLQKAPLLRAFEFREGLKVPEIIDTLCEHNKNIAAIAFDAHTLSTFMMEKIQKELPCIEFLQIPLITFLHHISMLGKFSKLKSLRCTQVFHEDGSYDVRHREPQPVGDTDWPAFESLQMYSEHVDTNFEIMLTHVRKNLLSLEIQALHSSKILEHVPFCVRLQKLKLNFSSRHIEDENLENFFSGLRNLNDLRFLSLTSFVHADANVLCKVFQKAKFSNLTELVLRHCAIFSPRAAQSIVASCPALSVIRINGCSTLDDLCLLELGRCTTLSVLDISGCHGVTEIGLSHLMSCYHLRELNLKWNGLLSSPLLGQIAKLKTLSTLHLDHTEANLTHLLDCINKLPALRFVSVYRVNGISGEDLQKALQHCSVRYTKPELSTLLKRNVNKMRKFQVRGAESVLASITDCETVEECTIDFLMRPHNEFPYLFHLFKKSKKLQSLTLLNFANSEEGLLCKLFDGGLPQLRVLQFEHCFSVDKDVVVSIANNFPQLEKLKLQNCTTLNDDGLAAIVQMQHLCVLDISDCCGLSETGLLLLGKCKNLQELNLCGVLSAPLCEDVLNCVLSLPELSILQVDFSDYTDKLLKSKNWCLKFEENGLAKYGSV